MITEMAFTLFGAKTSFNFFSFQIFRKREKLTENIFHLSYYLFSSPRSKYIYFFPHLIEVESKWVCWWLRIRMKRFEKRKCFQLILPSPFALLHWMNENGIFTRQLGTLLFNSRNLWATRISDVIRKSALFSPLKQKYFFFKCTQKLLLLSY